MNRTRRIARLTTNSRRVWQRAERKGNRRHRVVDQHRENGEARPVHLGIGQAPQKTKDAPDDDRHAEPVQDLIRAIEVTRDIIVQQVLKRAHQCHRTPSVQLT